MKRIALIGNPNAGKTTIFNSLTGLHAHVGNWPGVTVAKREGQCRHGDQTVDVVDLPGLYSLSPYSNEEVVARNFLIEGNVDCVVNVVDATNLERSLYLTTQLLEIDLPVVVALNLADVAEKNGDQIDVAMLERTLGVPVVRLGSLRHLHLDALLARILTAAERQRQGSTVLTAGAVGEEIDRFVTALQRQGVNSAYYHAVKLLERDPDAVTAFPRLTPTEPADYEAQIAAERYRYVTATLTAVRKRTRFHSVTKSDRLDDVLTHRVWAVPILLLIIFGIFHLTFGQDLFFLDAIFPLPTLADLGLTDAAGAPVNFGAKLLACVYDGAVRSPGVAFGNFWNEILVGGVFGLLGNLCGGSGLPAWCRGLLVDGVLGGVAAVLSFLPGILTLFLFFSLLEDSGYLARVAFILDSPFRRLGLSGRAFLPMLMGYGCSVPAIINTRTLTDDRERATTIRVIPFFYCGAKVPLLSALTGGMVTAFGVGNADLITYGLYLLGVVTAIIATLFFRRKSRYAAPPPFIMELPTYRRPPVRSLGVQLWDKTKHFIGKALTIILGSTVVVWTLSHFGWRGQYLPDAAVDQSLLAALGRLLQPVFTPLGFGAQLGAPGWVFAVATLAGLIAKENVVATLATLAACVAGAEGAIVPALVGATGIGLPGLLAFLAFNLLTVPCFAAVATARAEQPAKTFWGSLLFWVATSFLVGSLIYTLGRWWWTLFAWLTAATVFALWLRRPPGKKTKFQPLSTPVKKR